MPQAPHQRFLNLLRTALDDGRFRRLVLSRPRGKGPEEVLRIDARSILLRGEPMLSLVARQQQHSETRNLPTAAAVAEIAGLLGSSFGDAHLELADATAVLRHNRRGEPHLQCKQNKVARPPESLQHDREKPRCLPLDRPFLRQLGITDPTGMLVPRMARKYRQIDHFLLLFQQALQASPLAAQSALRVVDYGAGKGYLTFAVYDWLQQRGTAASVLGVERRPELVAAANEQARQLAASGLSFLAGDIADLPPQPADVLIALHACDQATDLALHRGLLQGATILLAAPCCHQELRPQLKPPPELQPLLQHGIHVEQTAEMLTDSLRALLLTAAGYSVRIQEFVALEHTAKNKLLLAVKHAAAAGPAAAAVQQARELMARFGIQTQALWRLLQPAAPS